VEDFVSRDCAAAELGDQGGVRQSVVGLFASGRRAPVLCGPEAAAHNRAHRLGVRLRQVAEHGALPRAWMHERVRQREASQNTTQNAMPEADREHARHALARHCLRAFDEDMLRLELLENLDDAERIVLALSVFDIDRRHDFTRKDLRSIQNDQAAVEAVVDSTNRHDC